MPAFSSFLGVAALLSSVGFGVASAIGAEESSGPSYTPSVSTTPPLPKLSPAPTPEDAEAKARAEAEKQRRIRLLAGGKTILASEGPVLSSGAGKSLLGS